MYGCCENSFYCRVLKIFLIGSAAADIEVPSVGHLDLAEVLSDQS